MERSDSSRETALEMAKPTAMAPATSNVARPVDKPPTLLPLTYSSIV